MSAPGPEGVSDALRPPSERVSPRARLMWIAVDGVRGLVVVVLLWFATGPWHWFDLPGWVLGVVGALLLAYAVLVPQWRYLVHRWEVTDTAVYTQSGWFDQERRIAPVSRIQTVDTERGPLEQLFGLSSVTVTTASAAGALEIKGLDREVADRLVDELTAATQADAEDAT